MFAVGVSDHVMVAHSFGDEFFGPAGKLHGATYAVDLEVRAPALGPHDVVMDIGALRTLLRAILADFDYTNLDEHPAFRGRMSTTERVAEYIADRVAERLTRLPSDARPVSGGSLRVKVRESPVAYAVYERGL